MTAIRLKAYNNNYIQSNLTFIVKIKMITHDNFILKSKKISADNNNILCLNLALGFSLNNLNINNRLIPAEQLDLIIKNTMGEDAFWDMGIPKGQAEFLVFGAAYSTKPVHALSVNVSVDNISKTLMVFGHREWTNHGASIANPFNLMPIKYNYAFGGNGFELNPDGIGYQATIGTLLPNIESSEELLVSMEDTVAPAGFEPFPANWQQRSQHFIQYPDIDFKMDSVVIPDDILPEHFNTAPNDQRLSKFFKGDETVQITNMHPLYSQINSKLPGKRLRVFAIQAKEERVEFKEMYVNADTLWLIPNLECGIIQYRARIIVNNMEASDIKNVFIELEDFSTEPKTINFFAAKFLETTQDLATASSENKERIRLKDNKSINYQIKQQPIHSKYNNSLQVAKKENDDYGVSELMAQFNQEIQKIMNTLKITDNDIEDYKLNRTNIGLPTHPSEEDILEAFKKTGLNAPEFEELLLKLNQLKNELDEDSDNKNHDIEKDQ